MIFDLLPGSLTALPWLLPSQKGMACLPIMIFQGQDVNFGGSSLEDISQNQVKFMNCILREKAGISWRIQPIHNIYIQLWWFQRVFEHLPHLEEMIQFDWYHVFGDTCHKRPCAYVNFLDHVTCTHVLAFMLDVTQEVGLGWGGVGMFTFLEDAHMFWHSC